MQGFKLQSQFQRTRLGYVYPFEFMFSWTSDNLLCAQVNASVVTDTCERKTYCGWWELQWQSVFVQWLVSAAGYLDRRGLGWTIAARVQQPERLRPTQASPPPPHGSTRIPLLDSSLVIRTCSQDLAKDNIKNCISTGWTGHETASKQNNLQELQKRQKNCAWLHRPCWHQ